MHSIALSSPHSMLFLLAVLSAIWLLAHFGVKNYHRFMHSSSAQKMLDAENVNGTEFDMKTIADMETFGMDEVSDSWKCPNTNPSFPGTRCPSESLGCCRIEHSNNGYGCKMQAVDVPGLVYCCTPGPRLQASTTVPNVMVLGDSVSIGYTVIVLEDWDFPSIARLQHSPWDTSSNDGAANISYGLSCFEVFMRSADHSPINWTLVQFNFGLHDLDNSAKGLQVYEQQLYAFTIRLLNYSQNSIKKLQYATTTPLMSYYNKGNHVVEDNNAIALKIMKQFDIPIVDLYERVMVQCGPPPYVNCSICDSSPCSFNYNTLGYEWIAETVDIAIRTRLAELNTKKSDELVISV